MFLKSTLCAFAIANCFPFIAAAENQWRIGANLLSYHIAPTVEFNEINPGLFLSLTFQAEQDYQYGLQGGAYLNSFEKRTSYLLAFASFEAIELRQSQIRIGGFAGFFEYPRIAEKAKDFGWPVIGNFVLATGPSLTWRFDNGTDVTLGFLPIFSKETKGVITLQTSVEF